MVFAGLRGEGDFTAGTCTLDEWFRVDFDDGLVEADVRVLEGGGRDMLEDVFVG